LAFGVSRLASRVWRLAFSTDVRATLVSRTCKLPSNHQFPVTTDQHKSDW